ncbi:MAG TPA: sulfite exporter TauE/SafE family protein [Methanoregulaceae archaeon]|nr:sulfite exporter TauE/SafE family protein [Methanoregulaceae archaeon]
MLAYLTYWYLLPVGILIAILAMSAGISGSNFWIPVYLIFLGLDEKISFWLALLTMIFGFGSGIIRNVKEKTVNWYIVKEYLKIAVPFAIFGTILIPFAPVQLLLLFFASFVFLYGAYLLYRYWFSYNEEEAAGLQRHNKIYWKRAAIGGFLKGLIATGTGKLIMPGILGHSRIRTPAEAVGSTVLIIFVVNLCALLFRLTPEFVQSLVIEKDLIFSIMIWVAPGVILGGQIGPAIAGKLSVKEMRIYVGVLLLGVAILIYLRAFMIF